MGCILRLMVYHSICRIFFPLVVLKINSLIINGFFRCSAMQQITAIKSHAFSVCRKMDFGSSEEVPASEGRFKLVLFKFVTVPLLFSLAPTPLPAARVVVKALREVPLPSPRPDLHPVVCLFPPVEIRVLRLWSLWTTGLAMGAH